jgi:hypothetical protein
MSQLYPFIHCPFISSFILQIFECLVCVCTLLTTGYKLNKSDADCFLGSEGSLLREMGSEPQPGRILFSMWVISSCETHSYFLGMPGLARRKQKMVKAWINSPYRFASCKVAVGQGHSRIKA